MVIYKIKLWAALNAATDVTEEIGMFQSDTAHMYQCHTANKSIQEIALCIAL
jgi:hypothetical protein